MKKFNEKKTKILKKINTFLNLFFHEKSIKSKLNLAEIDSILVIDFNAIGDAFMLEPFLRTLRNNVPHASIHMACRPHAKTIFKDQGIVSKYYFCERRILASKDNIIHDLLVAHRTLRNIRKTKYDLILEPRGDLRDILFMHFCNGKRKAGYTYTGGEYMMTDPVTPNESIEHLIDDKMYFLKEIGCSFSEDDKIPRYKLSEKQLADNAKFFQNHKIDNKRVIGIHPGASKDIKKWRKYPELLRMINKYYKDVFFLLFSEGDEFETDHELIDEAKRLRVNYYHVNTDLEEYIQRLALCDVVICNDSSAGHIAAALGVEVHVIFGPVLSSLAKPYSHEAVYVYENNDIECRPCNQGKCPNQVACLEKISVDEVFEGVRKSFRN